MTIHKRNYVPYPRNSWNAIFKINQYHPLYITGQRREITRSYWLMREKACDRILHLFLMKPPENQERSHDSIKTKALWLSADSLWQTERFPRELRDKAKVSPAAVLTRLSAAGPGQGCKVGDGHEKHARWKGRNPAAEHPGESTENTSRDQRMSLARLRDTK